MSHITLAVDVEAISTRNVTAATAELIDVCQPHAEVIAYAEGSSKRDPSDREDTNIGEMLAVGRALEALGRKLQKQADGRVRAAAEARRVREEKAARSGSVHEYASLQEYLAAALARYGVVDHPVKPEPATEPEPANESPYEPTVFLFNFDTPDGVL